MTREQHGRMSPESQASYEKVLARRDDYPDDPPPLPFTIPGEVEKRGLVAHNYSFGDTLITKDRLYSGLGGGWAVLAD